jgi:hypothetical protein
MVKRKVREEKHDVDSKDTNPAYEKMRINNISRNKSILESLNIDTEQSTNSERTKKESKSSRKSVKKEAKSTDDADLRRSKREKKEVVTYNEDQVFLEAEKPKPGNYIQPYSPAGMKVCGKFCKTAPDHRYFCFEV